VIRLAVRVTRAGAPGALDALLAFSPAGVEEVELDDEVQVEYVLYGAPGELPSERELRDGVGAALIAVQAREIADDWALRWRDFHEPVTLAERLFVRAPWHEAPDAAGLLDIVIEPGQAFGTGAHATTRLCLELLVELADAGERRGSLLDLGCGSGVIAIAAAKLGFDPVLALDHEAESVDATRANAQANGVTIDVRSGDLLADALPAADTIVANLLLPLLLDLARRLPEPPHRLIASGLLIDQADEVAAAFSARHRLREVRRTVSGDWAALVLVAADRRVSSETV
jgi:ribosomal protein L11 methyltransferase